MRIPVFPVEPVDARPLREFAVGKGATGLAFLRAQEGKREEVILVTDDAVSDGSYGLTPGQQQYFATYRVVAATTIFIAGAPAGVLTAVSTTNDGFYDNPANHLSPSTWRRKWRM